MMKYMVVGVAVLVVFFMMGMAIYSGKNDPPDIRRKQLEQETPFEKRIREKIENFYERIFGFFRRFRKR